MALFEKKDYVFRKKDRRAWLLAREELEAAGITGVRAGSVEVEPPVCGCGAKLDPRDFGKNGRIDRRLYYIRVPLSQLEQAKAALEGLV